MTDLDTKVERLRRELKAAEKTSETVARDDLGNPKGRLAASETDDHGREKGRRR